MESKNKLILVRFVAFAGRWTNQNAPMGKARADWLESSRLLMNYSRRGVPEGNDYIKVLFQKKRRLCDFTASEGGIREVKVCYGSPSTAS